MDGFAQRLKALRREKGLSQQALSEQLAVSKSSVNMYERGEREPGFATLHALAAFFEVDLDYLLGRAQHPKGTLGDGERLPVLGAIACGQPIFANEEREYIAADPALRADFCLYARGDSMIGARIYDGDLVFIRRQDTVENGAIAAVVIEDCATLKRVYYSPKEKTLWLHAENPNYPPLVYTAAELEQIHILGKAVAFQSRLQ